jgi:predicted DNA-binding protein with PD1-like motif
MNVFALRLTPNQDLKQSLKEFATVHDLQAGFILTAIGSLTQATIRFADQKTSEILPVKFEILSLNGTLSIHGIHLHITIADSTGRTIGGHLDNGCIIYTTAEIVIGESKDVVFTRTADSLTGFLELEIKPRSS